MKNLHSLMKRYGKGSLVCLAAAVGAAVMLGSTCSVLNKAPTVPVISGPSAGVVGVPVTFKVTAADPESDSIAFQFDWGDTTTLAWSNLVVAGETISVAHTYSDSGTYPVKAQAKDAKGKESSWSAGFALDVLAAGGGYPDSVYAEIATANYVHAGAITPDGKYLYVAHGEDSGAVTPIRLADRATLVPITFTAYPSDIVSSVDGSHMYVALPGADSVAAIRTADNITEREVSVVHRPMDLAVTPDGQFLLVTVVDPAPGYVLRLRASDLSVVDSFFPGGYVAGLAVDPAGEYAYVSVPNVVQVVALASLTLVDSFAVARSGPLGLSRDGRFLYAAVRAESGFVVARLEDKSVVAHVNVHDPQIGDFAATLGGDYLMLTRHRDIQYVDARTYAVVDSLVLAGENRRPLVMHPTADTMYLVGYNKIYLIGPR